MRTLLSCFEPKGSYSPISFSVSWLSVYWFYDLSTTVCQSAALTALRGSVVWSELRKSLYLWFFQSQVGSQNPPGQMLISFLTSSSTVLCRPNQCSCSASLKNSGHGIRLWGPLLLSVKLGGKSSRITVGTCVRAFLHALLCWTLAICHLRWTLHLNIASFVEMRGLLCSCLFLYPWMIFSVRQQQQRLFVLVLRVGRVKWILFSETAEPPSPWDACPLVFHLGWPKMVGAAPIPRSRIDLRCSLLQLGNLSPSSLRMSGKWRQQIALQIFILAFCWK